MRHSPLLLCCSAALLLFAPPARAEMLLATLTWGGGQQHGGNFVTDFDQPLPFEFTAGGSGGSVTMAGDYSRAQSGIPIEATPEQLAVFNSILDEPNGNLAIYVAALGRDFSVREFWGPFPFFEVYVPPAAPAPAESFAHYTITSVTQTVYNFRFDPIDGGICNLEYCGEAWRGNAVQTISIYGQLVPEPSAIVLFALCVSLVHVRGRRRRS